MKVTLMTDKVKIEFKPEEYNSIIGKISIISFMMKIMQLDNIRKLLLLLMLHF